MNELHEFRKILSNIFIKFNSTEMSNCLDELNKNLLSNYESIDLFLDLFFENFEKIKNLEFIINLGLFDTFKILMNIDKNGKDELFKKESFRSMLIKIIFLFLNTDGKNNPKSDNKKNDNIKNFIKNINDKSLILEIFKIFYIDLYTMKNIFLKNEFNIKYQFLNNSKDYCDYSDLNIKPLDFYQNRYLVFVIDLFTSLNPIKEIITYFKNYFHNFFLLYNTFFLCDYSDFKNFELKGKKEIEKKFYLCNFFHIFQTKNICYKFYFYLIKYVQSQSKDKKVLTTFPDVQALLINLFYLCPFPFYFNLIIDLFNNSDEFEKNEIYFDELIEMILDLDYKENYKNKNGKYFYNIIEFVKIFRFFSIKYKESSKYNGNKLMKFFNKFLYKIKNYGFIYSPYLIKVEEIKNNDENSLKTLLELCTICAISFFNDEDKLSDKNELSKLKSIFFNDNNNEFNNHEKTLFYDFDYSNYSLNYNNYNENKKINEDFNNYLCNINNSRKEERSLLLIIIIYLYNQNQQIVCKEEGIIKTLWNLLIDDLLILINNSGEFQKTKNFNYYNSVIDSFNSLIKIKNELNKDDILTIISTINIYNTSTENNLFNFIKNKKVQKNVKIIDYYTLLKNDRKNAKNCLFNSNCLILNKSKTESFFDLSDEETTNPILKSYFDIEMKYTIKCLKRDLLLKGISIYFNDIFFNDKNFIKLKNSFFYNYKNQLDNNYNEQLLQYPSKLKNFSSNEYATPKIFLACDTTLYKNKYFENLYPKINKNLLKNKSFPSLPSHYEYNQNLIKYNNNNLILNSFECEYISIKEIIFGEMHLYEKFIVFKNKDSFGDYKSNIKYIFSTGNSDVTVNKKIIIILYDEIGEIIYRTFAYINQAFEIF